MRDVDIVADLAPTGTLRVSINLGNPVLAQGSATRPSGVTVDIARELGFRLRLPVELICFDAARDSFEAMVAGRADIFFLAVDPAREKAVAFTAPYAVIEGVFAVPNGSAINSSADVDRPGVRIGVKKGSAYDLFLTRTLAHAEGPWHKGHRCVHRAATGGRGRDQAADRRLRCHPPRPPTPRTAFHGDSAGHRDHPHPE